MQAFMQAGHFHVSKQQAHQNKAVHALSIRDRANVLRVLDAMLPHLLVKKDQALDLYAYLDEHPGRTSPLRFKPLHELSTEQLHQWYIIEGQSCAAIAARYGVTAGGIGLLLKRPWHSSSQKLARDSKASPKVPKPVPVCSPVGNASGQTPPFGLCRRPPSVGGKRSPPRQTKYAACIGTSSRPCTRLRRSLASPSTPWARLYAETRHCHAGGFSTPAPRLTYAHC